MQNAPINSLKLIENCYQNFYLSWKESCENLN